MRGVLHQALAHRGGAGEGDLAQPRVLHQRPGDAGGAGGGHDVEHAGRQAGLHMVCAKSWEVSGVSLAGLSTMVQPAATAGATLRVAMASGKFHGVISRHGPTGLCCDQDLVLALRGGEVAAVVADGLLGEPAQEFGAVGDLAAGFGQRLAHFQGHQQREVLGPLGDQVEGPAQDLGAFPRRGAGPRGLDARPPRRARRAASSLVAEAKVARTSPVAGSWTSNVPPSDASRHCPPISRPVGTEARSSASRGVRQAVRSARACSHKDFLKNVSDGDGPAIGWRAITVLRLISSTSSAPVDATGRSVL